jgi:hypothetical protein
VPVPTRLAAVLFALFAASLSLAQGHRWGVSASAMFGQDWLGSEDTRRGAMYSVSMSHREPRLHFWGYDAELDYEAYYMFTKGGADFMAGPNSSHHYGVLLTGRYFQKYAKSSRAFVEGGWGLQYTDRLTHDLDSLWNSTPMVGAGIVVPFERTDLVISVRYFHISNAGTAGDNEGLNFFQLRFGLRF